jgi:hypothetical protein
MPPKKQMVPKTQAKVMIIFSSQKGHAMCLILTDKVKNFDLLKGL